MKEAFSLNNLLVGTVGAPEIGAEQPTPNPEIPTKIPHLRELFWKVRANFCPLPYDTSQEPNGNCSEKLVQMNFFILGGFFRVDFFLWCKMLAGAFWCKMTIMEGGFRVASDKCFASCAIWIASHIAVVIERSVPLRAGLSRRTTRKWDILAAPWLSSVLLRSFGHALHVCISVAECFACGAWARRSRVSTPSPLVQLFGKSLHTHKSAPSAAFFFPKGRAPYSKLILSTLLIKQRVLSLPHR